MTTTSNMFSAPASTTTDVTMLTNPATQQDHTVFQQYVAGVLNQQRTQPLHAQPAPKGESHTAQLRDSTSTDVLDEDHECLISQPTMTVAGFVSPEKYLSSFEPNMSPEKHSSFEPNKASSLNEPNKDKVASRNSETAFLPLPTPQEAAHMARAAWDRAVAEIFGDKIRQAANKGRMSVPVAVFSILEELKERGLEVSGDFPRSAEVETEVQELSGAEDQQVTTTPRKTGVQPVGSEHHQQPVTSPVQVHGGEKFTSSKHSSPGSSHSSAAQLLCLLEVDEEAYENVHPGDALLLKCVRLALERAGYVVGFLEDRDHDAALVGYAVTWGNYGVGKTIRRIDVSCMG